MIYYPILHQPCGLNEGLRRIGVCSAMGDVFLEQLVKKKSTGVDILKKCLILLAGLFLCLLGLNFVVSQFFGPIALLVAVGAIYFSWFFITSLNLEFEYIYTNGEIDVDKIMAKRKRKRMTTVKISAFEEFGTYDQEKFRSRSFDATVNAAVSPSEPETRYAVYRSREGKHCLLLFSPDERLLAEIEKIYNRRVRVPQ